MGDRGASRIGRFEVFFIQLLILRPVSRIAEIVSSLNDVSEIAAGVMKDLDQIFHRTAKLLFKSAGEDVAGFVHRGLAGNEDQIAVANGGAER